MGKKTSNKTLTSLKGLYLPYFIKHNKLSKEEISESKEISIDEERVRSFLVASLLLLLMIFYLIFASIYSFWKNGLGADLMMGAFGYLALVSFLYEGWLLLSTKHNFSFPTKEAVQFVFYLSLVIGILFMQVGDKYIEPDADKFSLSYIWFIALAITPCTYYIYWLILTGVSFAGAITASLLLNVSSSNLVQYLVLVLAFVIGSWAIRSYSFSRSYYKNKVAIQNDENLSASITDPLTGIENRRGLDRFVELKSAVWKTRNARVSLMVIDIDSFKVYNDTYGHLIGDAALKKVASIISSSLSSSDLNIFRFGGDEFVIVCEESDLDMVENYATKILQTVLDAKIKAPASLGYPYLTISMGVHSEIVGSDYSLASSFGKADKCLYATKNRGHGTLIIDDEIVR